MGNQKAAKRRGPVTSGHSIYANDVYDRGLITQNVFASRYYSIMYKIQVLNRHTKSL